MMREYHTRAWGRIIDRVVQVQNRAICSDVVAEDLKHLTVESLWVQEAVREHIPRDAMSAHTCFSFHGRTEKHLELNRYRIIHARDRRRGCNLVPGELVKLGCGGLVNNASESMETEWFIWRFHTELCPVLLLGRCRKGEDAAVRADWRGVGRKIDPSEYVPSEWRSQN